MLCLMPNQCYSVSERLKKIVSDQVGTNISPCMECVIQGCQSRFPDGIDECWDGLAGGMTRNSQPFSGDKKKQG